MAMPMYSPAVEYLKRSEGVRISSDVDLGLRFIRLGSGGLNPSAVAGGPSVTETNARAMR